jgi:hypothetical protein
MRMLRVGCAKPKNSCGKILGWLLGWQGFDVRTMYLSARTRVFGWSRRCFKLCKPGVLWIPPRDGLPIGGMAERGMWILFWRRQRVSWGWKSKLRRMSRHRMALGFEHCVRPCPKEGHFYAGSCFMAGLSRDHSGGKSLPCLGVI